MKKKIRCSVCGSGNIELVSQGIAQTGYCIVENWKCKDCGWFKVICKETKRRG
ncbi:MAG TPA: hypothetical protein P5150_08250 [Candidatus Ratteibacteria bacterium]|nr:hypothetical protein [Candidatus Ratteibacteria bacterium]